MGGARGADDRDGEFTGFIRAESAGLIRLAFLLTAERGAAEELFQESAARAFLAWDRLRSADDPRAYLRQVMVNANRRRFRRKQVAVMLCDPTNEWAVSEDAYARIDDRFDLAAVLAKLPARQRAVVVLRCCEDLPTHEVARLLGCSTGTVKTQLSRALARLRFLLPEPGSSGDDLDVFDETLPGGER